jgi:CDP-paratose 2-epimerase
MGGGINNTGSLLEIIELIEAVSGKKAKIKFSRPRPGDQKYYVSNIDKAFRDFNWKPQISVEQGIRMLYEWFEESLT